MIEQELVALLKNNGISNGRVFPYRIPITDESFPLIRYKKVTGQPIYSHSGDSGLNRDIFQFDIYGKDTTGGSGYASVKEVAEELKSLVSGYSTTTDSGGRYLIKISNEVDMYEEEARLNRVMVEVEVWHK